MCSFAPSRRQNANGSRLGSFVFHLGVFTTIRTPPCTRQLLNSTYAIAKRFRIMVVQPLSWVNYPSIVGKLPILESVNG
jgi:hypothetical protein